MLAALIFVAGAASGGLLGRREASPRALLQAEANLPTAPPATDGQNPGAENKPERGTKAPRRATKQESHRFAPAKWAANVLGVTVGIDGRGVRLAWERPTQSNRVVVVRRLVSHRHSVVVFQGQATSFRDISARPCTAYRYVIINYDRPGHPSTGVPTSVVTQGCGRKASGRSSA
jgi:hypothetical protein